MKTKGTAGREEREREGKEHLINKVVSCSHEALVTCRAWRKRGGLQVATNAQGVASATPFCVLPLKGSWRKCSFNGESWDNVASNWVACIAFVG